MMQSIFLATYSFIDYQLIFLIITPDSPPCLYTFSISREGEKLICTPVLVAARTWAAFLWRSRTSRTMSNARLRVYLGFRLFLTVSDLRCGIRSRSSLDRIIIRPPCIRVANAAIRGLHADTPHLARAQQHVCYLHNELRSRGATSARSRATMRAKFRTRVVIDTPRLRHAPGDGAKRVQGRTARP